jgi:integrase
MKTYLIKTKFQTYKYVRRVPKPLLEYASTATFRVSLGSNVLEATQQALEFNNAIEEALQLISLNLADELILSKLEKLIPMDKEQEQQITKEEQGLFRNVVTEYIASQESNISAEETRDKSYFYKEVCPALFRHLGITDNPILRNINYTHLLEFRNMITKLPKRNIHKYRTMEISKILLHLDAVANADRLSPRTANKYVKWLRALFNFAVMLNHIQVNLANSIPLLKTLDDKLQRLPLDEVELNALLESVPQQMQYLLQILAYTGLRLSELYKCTLAEIDGYKCFSLTDRGIKLKTKSSYRVIPIHSRLLDGMKEFEESRGKVSSDNLARTASDTIKKLKFKDMEKKSLYSLRHRFATQLIQKGADSSIVSELMGHSHNTMTLSRYSTGFSVRQLQEVVELL